MCLVGLVYQRNRKVGVPVNAAIIRAPFHHVVWKIKRGHCHSWLHPPSNTNGSVSCSKEHNVEDYVAVVEQSWCPACPFCQLSTFLSRGCLLRAVGPGSKPCCPGISGGSRVKGYSCVSCFLLQLLTRASIHQQALLHCSSPPLLLPPANE